MTKINENLYMYKGVYVKKLSNGMYKAHFYINSISGLCTVSGVTQEGFKRVFNNFIKTNKGIDKAMTDEYNNRNFKEVK